MPAQPEVAAPAKAGGRPLGELEDAAPAVLRVIKIETPEASVSGVFNLRRNFRGIPLILFYPPNRLMPSARVKRAATRFRHNREAGRVIRDRIPLISHS